MDFDSANENGDDAKVLALADGENSREGTKIFMEQKLKTFLTSDGGEAKSSSQFENDLSAEGGEEATDCFDSETVLLSREISNPNDETRKNQEVILTANVTLTASEAEREKMRARQTHEGEDEFYNALTQRVL